MQTKYVWLFLLLPLGILSISCKKEPLVKTLHFEKQSLLKSANDVSLPLSLWQKIDETYVPTGSAPKSHGGESAKGEGGKEAGGKEGEAKSEKGGEKEGAKGEEKKSEHGGAPPAEHGGAPPAEKGGAPSGEHGASKEKSGEGGGKKVQLEKPDVDFAAVRVFLMERTPGILGGKNLELNFGSGGGELDLADYVQLDRGTFSVAFEISSPHGEAPLRVFFLSNSRRRKIGYEEYGSGCENFYEISSYFNKAMLDRGLLVSSTDRRHVSALVGTYILAYNYDTKLNLSQVTIKDSRFKDLHCRK